MELKSGSRDAELDESDEADSRSTEEEAFEPDEKARPEKTIEAAVEEDNT